MKLSLILTLFFASVANSYLLPTPGSGDCGISSSTDDFVGRKETNLDEFPWLALLGYKNKNDDSLKFLCIGALINSRYVLTTAACVLLRNSNLSVVRLGEWDLDATNDCDSTGCTDAIQEIPVEEVIKHSEYKLSRKAPKHNNIALLRLETPVKLNKFVKPLCLPMKNQTDEASNFIFAGWSLPGFFQDRLSKKSKIKLKIVDQETCKQSNEKFSLEIMESQFCAVGETSGIDTCGGDGGGPLVALRDDGKGGKYYYAAGLVSYGTKICGDPKTLGVYTRVSSFLDWIEENVKE
ncbi:phenoloxidase-activating factor 3-like [Culicoides brevitarsis]|uniref:phenoloxidase-activating factor 3-like n=1 Tax=Culicoides brevitarsis TaxID=469753 RepID=UPI00307CB181